MKWLHGYSVPTLAKQCRVQVVLLVVALLALGQVLVSCVEKLPAPRVADAFEWQKNGFIAGQVNGFTRDSFRLNENFRYTSVLDPFLSHYRVDTITPLGRPQPLFIFDIQRYDPKTGASISLKFAVDSLGGRTRRPSTYFPQEASINFVTPGLNGELITYGTTQRGTRGPDDKTILIDQIIYNEQVNRLLGTFTFRERLGMRDTTVLYGPEVRGNFDLFVKRKLR